MCPNLVILAVEYNFKHINWVKKGTKLDKDYLNHLRFADNMVLISSDIKERKKMIEQLNQASKAVGVEINISKTKIMN